MPYLRVYLDTCVLVNALLENESTSYDKEKNTSIRSAKRILSEFDPSGIVLSPYTIAEFKSIGMRKDFGKTEGEMDAMTENLIKSGCSILNASMKRSGGPIKIEKMYGNASWMFAQVKAEGLFVKDGGKSDKGRFRIIVSNDAEVFTGRSGSEVAMDKEAKMVSIDKFEISAPAFEHEFFREAVKFVNIYGLRLADAIHMIYATNRNDVDIIVSDDKDFIKNVEKLPKDYTQKIIKIMNSTSFVEEMV